MSKTPMNIAVFASGGGSNAVRIALHFRESTTARVRLIVTNNPRAGVVESALKNGLPVIVMNAEDVSNGEALAQLLQKDQIDIIVLAGYLKLIPPALIDAFTGRMVNLHPALLPKHGGPGMYGARVHRAVEASGDRITGITLHHVSAEYDCGDTIAQYETEIDPNDNVVDIERKVRALEEQHVATAIEKWIETLV